MSELTNLQKRKKELESRLPKYEKYLNEMHLHEDVHVTTWHTESPYKIDRTIALTPTAKAHLNVGIDISMNEMLIELQLINEKLEAIETLLAS